MSTTTITAATGRYTIPALIFPVTTSRSSGNKITRLLDGSLSVSLQHSAPRTGQLRMLYLTADEAFDALDMHALPTTFSLVSEAIPALDMTYVVDGDVEVTQHDTFRNRWTLVVDFQEVVS